MSAAKSMKNPTVANEQREPRRAFGLGLEGIGDLSGLLDAPKPLDAEHGPMEIPLDLIDEDPNQPRRPDNPGFTRESIAEIGETIRARGVKSPISVRDNVDSPGRFVINHGARRFRGSKYAGKTTIPAFVDNDYNQADQVIENLQRDELTPREIADFIGRELAKGTKKSEIAKMIGKSPAFVTQHVTLLDLPDPIALAFTGGRANDVTVVNELVTAYKKNPVEVVTWLDDKDQELTRGSVKLLREFLEAKRGQHTEDAPEQPTVAPDQASTRVASPPAETAADNVESSRPAADPSKLRKAIVKVEHVGRPARLHLARRPSTDGWAWLKYDEDGQEVHADLNTVKLIALIEG